MRASRGHRHPLRDQGRRRQIGDSYSCLAGARKQQSLILQAAAR